MTPKEYYIKHTLCFKDGDAIRQDKTDILLCVKYGGECKMSKCIKIHNNNKKK